MTLRQLAPVQSADWGLKATEVKRYYKVKDKSAASRLFESCRTRARVLIGQNGWGQHLEYNNPKNFSPATPDPILRSRTIRAKTNGPGSLGSQCFPSDV